MLKLELIVALGILMCGQVLFWRRRDNIFGYFQAGLFFASVLIPILGTTVIDTADPDVVNLYARILLVGAVAYLFGLCCGAPIGARSRRPRVSFAERFDDAPRKLVRRSRVVAVVGVLGLIAAFALLGYAPLLAADRVSAKYGVGPYRAGFMRGAQVFNLALTLASTITAVLVALIAIRRRAVDIVLLVALVVGMTLTLSRGLALAGPLAFLIAWGIERRWRPWRLLVIVCLSFVAGALVNELTFVKAPVASASFSSRVAGTIPDIPDHLGFLQGFHLLGDEHVGLKTIRAGVSLTVSKGYWDPADYALRVRTGLPDVTELASGGLRLPAPVWGYAAYGFLGVVVWSAIAGFFTGWGTTLLRRLLADVEHGRYRHQALNLMLAWIFYNGTFVVLALFYFPARSEIVVVGLAFWLCVFKIRSTSESPAGEDGATLRPAAQA
jgi:hypothetical protein